MHRAGIRRRENPSRAQSVQWVGCKKKKGKASAILHRQVRFQREGHPVKIAPGWYADNCTDSAAGKSVCQTSKPCKEGTIASRSHDKLSCDLCGAGQTSFSAALSCHPCPRGKYAEAKGSRCRNCPAGYFQPQEVQPSTVCEKCPRGWDEILDDESGKPVNGSAVCRDLKWKRAQDCGDDQFLDNRLKDKPAQWNCATCPPGGACTGAVSWDDLGPLFGWWKIPAAQRGVSGQEFAPCVYPPACLGVSNRAFENQFFADVDGDQIDLAMVVGSLDDDGSVNATGTETSEKTNLTVMARAFNQTCAVALGFRLQSRLCHQCSATARRQGIARCALCPDWGQTVGLIIIGVFVTLGVIVFLVSTGIRDAGKVELSAGIQKILLNFLQVTSFAQKFPLRWPKALEGLFEFQGAVSTLGEHLLNPDCLSETTELGSAASLFYSKQALFAFTPLMSTAVAFAFWYVKGAQHGTPFFQKRSGTNDTTPKDKFVLTVCTVVYLLFPTLITQAFQMFHCRTIASVQYLAADLEEPCYTGRHLAMVFVLGFTQLFAYVVGLPALVLVFLRRNKHLDGGGLSKHASIVRYGLFYAAFKDDAYYWEAVLAARKICIVALSVFGPSVGTERQVQMVLAVLLVCISLEIAGSPYKVITDRFRILSRLEIGTLFVQWATMWCGSLIFASQDKESEGFVVFLSFVVLAINLAMLLWLVLRLLMECTYENRKKEVEANSLQQGGDKKTVSARGGGMVLSKIAELGDRVKRMRLQRLSEAERQRRTRSNTVEDPSGSNTLNPTLSVSIELGEMTTNPKFVLDDEGRPVESGFFQTVASR